MDILFRGETFNQRKREYLKDLARSKSNLELFQKCAVTFPKQRNQWVELVQLEKETFNITLNDLIALKKWRIKTGIGENDEYGLQAQAS